MNKMSEKDKQSNWYANKKIRNSKYSKENYVTKEVALTPDDYEGIMEIIGETGVNKTGFVVSGMNLLFSGKLEETIKEFNKNPRKPVNKNLEEGSPRVKRYTCTFKPEKWEEIDSYLKEHNMTLGKLLRVTYIYVKGDNKND